LEAAFGALLRPHPKVLERVSDRQDELLVSDRQDELLDIAGDCSAKLQPA